MGKGAHGGCGAPPLPGAPASKYPTISIAEATRRVLAAVPGRTPVRTLKLSGAPGHVLAADVVAPEPLPPFPASIKDGYAVVSSDGPGDYDIVGDARCGDAPTYTVKPGSVAYITTGGPVPPGADAVVMVERTNELPARADGTRRVRILESAPKGQDIRPVGCDIQAGQTVLEAGEWLGPGEIGLLAGAGAHEVDVYSAPKVAVMSSGDEVVEPSVKELGPGQIRDSNRAMLLAVARSAGGQIKDLGIAEDKKETIEAQFDAALEWGANILLTSGGVSMGDRDYVKPLLEKRGTVHFGRVLMKPGKPLTFATLEATNGHKMLVFGLPGNPVSALVCFYLTVVPAIRKLAGWKEPHLRRVTCKLAQPLKMDPERPEYHRATVSWTTEGGLIAHSTGGGLSSRLLSTRSANALLELPREKGTLPAGSTVSALLIADLARMPVNEEIPVTTVTTATPPPRSSQEDGTHSPHFESPATKLEDTAKLYLAAVGGMVLASGGRVPKVSTPALVCGTAAAAVCGAVLLQRRLRQWFPSVMEFFASPGVVRVAILTVSDTCAAGKAEDRGGPAAIEAVQAVGDALGGVAVVATSIVPDEVPLIQHTIKAWCDSGKVDFVLTTGGTGFMPRDVTPEATRPLLDREAPGFVLAMLKESMRITPMAMLSRPVAGMRGKTLIVNTPGNPKAVGECLNALMPALPIALRQLRGLSGKPNHSASASAAGPPTAAEVKPSRHPPTPVKTGCGCDH